MDSIPYRNTLLLLAIWLFTACALEAPRPLIRIASDATFAPFHLLDEAGEPTGFDIELARAVAEHAGFKVEVLVLPYDELFSGLKSGMHDVVAATTGITLERERVFLFTEPYFQTCQAALVRLGSSEPTSLFELREARIGAAGSGTSMTAMNETFAAEYVHIAAGQGIQMLQAREIDAWIVDEFDAVAAARASQGRLAVLPEPVMLESYAFVLAAGRTDLKARLDKSLAALEQDGSVAKLRIEFGTDRDADWPVEW